MDNNVSLADIGALMGSRDGNCFGGSGAWVLIILFALIFGNGGFFGGNGERNATVGDVQRATDFAALERQNNETVAAVRQAAYDNQGAIKDGQLLLLSPTAQEVAGLLALLSIVVRSLAMW